MALAACALLVAGCTSGPSAHRSTATTTIPASLAYRCSGSSCTGLVNVGHNRAISLECRGTGSPTVVLVSGQGERADNWSQLPDANGTLVASPNAVYPQVAQFSRVCAYDRPGTTNTTPAGFDKTRSTPVRQPITPDRSAADLHALLKASHQHGPFVLVGQSYGGDIIRVFASEHPKETAGLVLVDALSEYLGDALSPRQLAELQKLNSPVTQGRPAGSESVDLKQTFAQLRRTKDPKVPTVVLSADQWQITPEVMAAAGLPPSFSEVLRSAQQKAQARLAGLFPGGTWVTKTDAGHYIQLDQPQLVTNWIRTVVDRAR